MSPKEERWPPVAFEGITFVDPILRETTSCYPSCCIFCHADQHTGSMWCELSQRAIEHKQEEGVPDWCRLREKPVYVYYQERD